MEQRVARWEVDVSAIKVDVAIILSNYATKNDVQALRTEMTAQDGSVRAEIGALHNEMTAEFASVRAEIAGLRKEMTAEFASVRAEIAGLRNEMTAEFGSVRTEIESVRTQVQSLRIVILESAVATQRWMLATIIGLFIGFGGLALGMGNFLKSAIPVVQSQSAAQPPPIVSPRSR